MQENPETRPIPACPAQVFCDAARQIVNDPATYHDHPIARRLAWIALLAERGKSADQARLAMMQSGRAV